MGLVLTPSKRAEGFIGCPHYVLGIFNQCWRLEGWQLAIQEHSFTLGHCPKPFMKGSMVLPVLLMITCKGFLMHVCIEIGLLAFPGFKSSPLGKTRLIFSSSRPGEPRKFVGLNSTATLEARALASAMRLLMALDFCYSISQS